MPSFSSVLLFTSLRERYEFDHRFVSILHFSYEIYGFSYVDDNDKYSEKETKPVYKRLERYDFFLRIEDQRRVV